MTDDDVIGGFPRWERDRLAVELAFDGAAEWKVRTDQSPSPEWTTGEFGDLLGRVVAGDDGTTGLGRVHPEDVALARAALVRLALDAQRADFSLRVIGGPVGERLLDCRAALRAGPGDERLLVVAAREGAGQHAESQGLAESQAHVKSIIERIPAVTYFEQVTDPHGNGDDAATVTYVSPQSAVILGVDPAEAIGDPGFWSRRMHPADRERVREVYETSRRSGERFVADYRVCMPDDRVAWVRHDAQLVEGPDGGPGYWLGLVFDIDDSKRQEEELRGRARQLEVENRLIEQQRLALLGTLTAGVAHELRTPMDQLIERAEAAEALAAEAQRALAANPGTRDLETILGELGAITATIHDLGTQALDMMISMLILSRSGRGAPAAVDLNALVKRYGRLAQLGLRGRGVEVDARLVYQLDEQLPIIEAVESEIGRVVISLIYNAFESTALAASSVGGGSAGGGIDPTVTVSTARADADLVHIRVHDNGVGVRGEVREYIFEPFFTTKPAGEGAGLGLATSRDLVRQHGGEILIDSAPGEFAEFRVILPIRGPLGVVRKRLPRLDAGRTGENTSSAP